MTVNPGEYEPGEDGGPASNAEFAWKRKQEKAVRDAERARDAAIKEAAFLRAGIDPESKGIAAYFVKGYDGPLDAEAIKAAALEAGVVQPPAPSPEQQQRAGEVQTTTQVAGYATDATAAPTADETQRAALEEAYRTGGVDGMAAYLASQGIPQVTQ